MLCPHCTSQKCSDTTITHSACSTTTNKNAGLLHIHTCTCTLAQLSGNNILYGDSLMSWHLPAGYCFRFWAPPHAGSSLALVSVAVPPSLSWSWTVSHCQHSLAEAVLSVLPRQLHSDLGVHSFGCVHSHDPFVHCWSPLGRLQPNTNGHVWQAQSVSYMYSLSLSGFVQSS